jgi:hypothetical protein
MSGVVKIDIRETESELKALLGREKEAHRHEKLLLLYWLKTQTVETVLSAAVRRTGNLVPRYKDGCLVIEKEE